MLPVIFPVVFIAVERLFDLGGGIGSLAVRLGNGNHRTLEIGHIQVVDSVEGFKLVRHFHKAEFAGLPGFGVFDDLAVQDPAKFGKKTHQIIPGSLRTKITYK